jgi:hypothetical protein
MIKRKTQFDSGFRLIALFVLLQMLMACSVPIIGGYGSAGRSREEFERYVEDVFKLQNQVTSQVMLLLESGDIQSEQPVMKAEQHMQEICSPINEYASRDIDGLTIGFFLRRQVEKSAEDCDKAAHEVTVLLKQIEL